MNITSRVAAMPMAATCPSARFELRLHSSRQSRLKITVPPEAMMAGAAPLQAVFMASHGRSCRRSSSR
ncbi:hypothetical protein PSN01_02846 [Micromonospora saelicesensis]|nr:hypothetical protein PSN01_02846 [Micromonospora saelicesensis]